MLSSAPFQASMTRRQFQRTLALLAGALLCGRPRTLLAADSTDAAALRQALAKKTVFHPRAAWTRAAPIYSRLGPTTPYERITIHHEGNRTNHNLALENVVQDLRQVWGAHRRLGYGDIGYHFIIDHAGRVWEGRSLQYQGAHVSGNNPGNLGVMLLGNFELQKPAPAQKATLLQLVTLLRKHYGIPRRQVYGHRDLDRTLCPGRHLYAFMPTLNASPTRRIRAG